MGRLVRTSSGQASTKMYASILAWLSTVKIVSDRYRPVNGQGLNHVQAEMQPTII